VLRAEIEVSRLEGQLRAIQSEVRAAEAMLNASLARSADAEVPPLQSSASLALPPEWRGARALAIGHRPELAAGHAEIERAEAEVDVMQSMYSPMAMLRTGPAYTMSEGPGWMLMVGVSVPLWAMVEMSKADLSAMTRMVEGETAVSRHRVLAARERCLALQDEIIPRAQRLIEPSLAGYAAGTLPLVSVIEAAQTLWSAQAELVQAQFELGLAWTELDRAMANEGSN
jgi:outer membrane protein TolC